MKHHDKKIGKIIDEFSMFLLRNKCSDININIHCDEYEDILTFKFKVPKPAVLDLLKETLTQERDESIEEYGWELLGENDCGSELNLIGMCLDTCDFEVEGEQATVIMTRLQ